METFYLVKADTGSQIKVSLVREDTGLPIDCRDETVRLHFRKKGTSTKLFTLTTITSDPQLLAEGTVVFAFETNLNTIQPGYYNGEVELENNTSGTVQTVYEVLPFRVRDQVG